MEQPKFLDLRLISGLLMILVAELISLAAIGGGWGWLEAVALAIVGGFLCFNAYDRPRLVSLIFAGVALIGIPIGGILVLLSTAGTLFAGLLVIFATLSFGTALCALITQ